MILPISPERMQNMNLAAFVASNHNLDQSELCLLWCSAVLYSDPFQHVPGDLHATCSALFSLQRNEFSHTIIHGLPAPGKLLVAHKPQQERDTGKDAAAGVQASRMPPAGSLLPAKPPLTVGKHRKCSLAV